MSINILRPHKAKNSLPGNFTYPLYAKTLDILKTQKNILAANQN